MQPAPSPATPEQLLEHDAFLRSLARGLVGEASGADDVVQQAYMTALSRGAAAGIGGSSLRAWLGGIVRRLAWRRPRSEDRRTRHERALAPPDPVPSVAEIVELEESRRRVVAAVLTLDEPARSTMLLRYFRQMPPAAIARHFGVPVETVRTRIKRALERLRLDLDRAWPGGRSQWLAALVPFTVSKGAAIGGATVGGAIGGLLGAGVLAMSLKAKVVAAVVLVGGIAATVAWMQSDGIGAGSGRGDHAARHAATSEPASAAAVDRVAPADAERIAEPDANAERDRSTRDASLATGAVLVQMRRHDGGSCAGLGVTLVSWSQPQPEAFALEAVTGEDGTCRFDGVVPGSATLQVDLGGSASAEVEAAKETKVELWLNPGVGVAGEVVDRDGRGVSGAIVAACDSRSSFARPIARTDSEGRFTVASLELPRLLTASAPRFAPSPYRYLGDARDGRAQIRLVLSRTGGEATGRVIGPDQKPVARALVQLGDERRLVQASTRGDLGAVAQLQHARTDPEGRFHFAGTRTGEVPIAVRAAGLAPWSSTLTIAEGASVEVDVTLVGGAVLEGSVVSASGEAVEGATVRIGSSRSCNGSSARTVAGGRYRLEHLAPGPFEAVVFTQTLGTTRKPFVATDGATLTWEAVLEPGPTLRGRVIDEAEHPVPGCRIMAHAPGEDPNEYSLRHTTTDEEGRFALENCLPRAHQVDVHPPQQGFTSTPMITDVWPGGDELLVRLTHPESASAFVSGIVTDADGSPIAGASVFPFPRIESGLGGVPSSTDAEGRFRAGPLAPGKYDLSINANGHVRHETSTIELHADEQLDVGTIRLPRGGTFKARLVRADGKPSDGIELALRALDRWETPPCGLENDTAAATLRPGRWELRTRGGGCAPTLTSFEVRAGEETAFEVTLTPATEIVLLVRGLDVAMAKQQVSTPYALVRLLDSSDRELASKALPAHEGHVPEWRIPLAAGAYAIEVVEGATAGPRARFKVEENAREGEEVELEIR